MNRSHARGRSHGGGGNGGGGGGRPGGGRPAAHRSAARRSHGSRPQHSPPDREPLQYDSIADAVRSLRTVDLRSTSASLTSYGEVGRASSAAAASSGSGSSSDSDFLLSGAEKREKQERKERQKQALQRLAEAGGTDSAVASDERDERLAAAAASSPPTAQPRHLPGYFFDAKRNKYFKILPSHVHAAAAGMDADDEETDPGGFGSVHSLLQRRKAAHRRASGEDTASQRKRSKIEGHVPPPSCRRQLNTHSTSRSLLCDLLARQYFARCSPASIVQTHLPNLLKPVGFPILHADTSYPPRSFTPFTAETLSSDFRSHVSAEHALEYEATSRMLSVCGNRSRTIARAPSAEREVCTPAGPTGNGSFHSSFLLHPVESCGARALVHPEDRLHALPFRAQLMSDFETNSAITSLHRIHRWTMRDHPRPPSRPASAAGPAHPLLFDTARRLHQDALARERDQQQGDMWSSDEASSIDDDEADSVRHLLAYTTLGREHSTGLFRVRVEAAYGLEPHVLFTHHIANGSVWTSSFPQSTLSGEGGGALKVSLGCTKGALVLDLLTGQRVHTVHTNKSDVLSQAWLDHGSSDANTLLNGSRDGVIRFADTRSRIGGGGAGSGGSSSASLRMTSSVCWLHPLRSNPYHLAAAAVDGQLCLFDIRRSPSASSASSHSSSRAALTQALLTFHGHVDSYSRVRAHLDAAEHWLFCGGEDGLVRAWDVRHGRLQLEASPLASPDLPLLAASPPLSRRPIAWKHTLFLDEFHTLLAGSESGLAAMTMHR